MGKVIFKKVMSITLSMLLALSVLITQPQKFKEFSTYAATNEQIIYNFLKNELGLNTAAACGVLANIEKESSFRADIIEYGYSWATGGGYGICQWTNSPRTSSTGRRTNLVNFCNSRGYNYKSLTGQLYFLKYELETNVKPGVYNYLKQVSNTADGAYNAGWKWCYSFEVPANRSNVSVTRGNLAKDKYWTKYSGQSINDTELGIPYPRPSGSPLLQVGSKGNSVKWLQTALNKYMNAGLVVDGDFGNGTKTAVKNFQSKCKLSVDGIAGPATIKKLVECLRARIPQTTTTKATTKKTTTKITTTKRTTTKTTTKRTTAKTTTKRTTAKTTTKRTTAKTTTYNTNYPSYSVPTRTLVYQSTNMYGSDVKWFQSAINYLIIKGDKNGSKLSTSKLSVDGYYGSASQRACIAFQKKYGLTQDGKFGPASLSKMKEMLKKTTTKATTKKTTTKTTTKRTTTKTTTKRTTAKTTTYNTNYPSYSVPTRTLVYQSTNMYGSDVKWFQSAINYLIIKGDKNGSKLSTSKLSVDGYYGSASQRACIAFQKKYGLTQDGKFGPASLSKMKEMLKKTTTKATTKSTTKSTTRATTKTTINSIYKTNFNSYTAPTRNLSYNSNSIMTGNDVRWFQCAINHLIINGDKNGKKLSTSKLIVNGSYNYASKTACIAFQKKYGLDADGIFGPASLRKMKEVLNLTIYEPISPEVTYFNRNDRTQLTKHFNVSEFRCKCGGTHRTTLNVALVYKLEELMGVIGADKAIISSGYRCSKHDINVGGSGSGQHTYGNAVDICFYDKNGKVISSKIVSCKAQDLGFTGIANINKNYAYIHLDIRTTGTYYGNEVYGYNTVTSDFYAYYGYSR